jgi:hypothetical protein
VQAKRDIASFWCTSLVLVKFPARLPSSAVIEMAADDTTVGSTPITAGGSAWLKASRNMTMWKKRLAEGPIITVPTITLEGDANGAPHPDVSSYAKTFSGKYSHRIITGASVTICLRKPRRPLPKLGSTSTAIDRR